MQGLPDKSDDQVLMDKGSTKRQNNEVIASAGAPESNDCAEFSDGKKSGLSSKRLVVNTYEHVGDSLCPCSHDDCG
jgi:hypothetical protein